MTRQPVSKESVSEGATRLLRAWAPPMTCWVTTKSSCTAASAATTGMTACMRWTHQTSHKSSRSVIPRPLLPSWMCDSLHHLGQPRYLVVERLELSIHSRVPAGWPPYLLPHPADHLGRTPNYIRD